MSLVELQFPQVTKQGQAYYGGSQKWFAKKLHQDAGCASVCAANIAAYYAANHPALLKLYQGDATCFKQEEYISVMERLCGYMPPSPALGIPYLQRFIQSFLRYAQDCGVPFRYRDMRRLHSWEQGFAFVRQAVDGGHPVALLILRHSDPEFFEDTWHWVTISGYVDDPVSPKVIYSNFGSRDVHSADRLFEADADNILYMAYFDTEEIAHDQSAGIHP